MSPAFRHDHNIPDDFLLPIEYHALFSAILPGNRHEWVDLSTRYYPELARFHDKQWELPLPEPYTWQWDALRAGARFAEDVKYGLLVHEMVGELPKR